MGTSYRVPLLRFAAAGIIFSFTVAGGAQAQDAGHWTGFSIYGGGGMSMFNTGVKGDVERFDNLFQCQGAPDLCPVPGVLSVPFVHQTFGQNFDLSDLGGDGGFGTVGAAYDFRIAPLWTLGAFVDADWFGGMDATATHNSDFIAEYNDIPIVNFPNSDFGSRGQINSTTEVDLNWDINVGGKVGRVFWGNTLLYFLAAYTHADLDSRMNVHTNAAFFNNKFQLAEGGCEVFSDPEDPFGCPIDLNIKGPDSADGFTLGFGGDVQLGLSGNWFVRGEGRWTHLDLSGGGHDEDFSHGQVCALPDTSVCVLTVGRNSGASADARFDDIDLLTARVALVYRFGGGYTELPPIK